MTEAEWLACDDPAAMLDFVGDYASDRKRRLFACACCRRIGPLLAEESRQALAVLERCTDGRGSRRELEDALAAAELVEVATFGPARAAARAVSSAWSAAEHARSAAAKTAADGVAERRHQAALLRCLFGPLPFRPPPAIDAAVLAWNDAAVPRIAAAIYDDRRFDDLPVLADALEEAGCADAELLGHCRGGGEHTRGCWPVDLVLGRA